jgi:hypothetical protein
VDDIFDDGSCHSQQRFQPLNPVTQVFRAETSAAQPLQVDTRIMSQFKIPSFSFLMGYNPTDIGENCVVRHLKVSYDKKGLILSMKIVS